MKTLSKKYEDALVYAFRLHTDQSRKANDVPYISHLLSVSALVLEYGGNEDEAIAGLLHDAVEDQGGYNTLNEIQNRFGNKVADIVDSCSDAYVNPKPPWRQRKEAYLERMLHHTPGARKVSLADKLHNARSLLVLLRGEGDSIWNKFNGGKEGSLWYFQALNERFKATGTDAMTEEFDIVINELITISN